MITALIAATLKARDLGRDPNKVQDWERASRVMMALATKLRLTPQCRTRPESIARQQYAVGPWHDEDDPPWEDEPKQPWDREDKRRTPPSPTDPKYDS